jgi:hypothetical protein
MSATTKELPAYLDELGVKVIIKAAEHPKSAPEWALKWANAYRVAVIYEGKRASFFFYQGKGAKWDLTAADIIHDLARNYDSSCYTLKEFGDEFGWDSNTAATYRAVKRQAERFKRLFPDELTRQTIAEMEY